MSEQPPESAAPSAGHQSRWAVFEPQWYLLRYPEAQEQMARLGLADPELFYRQVGYSHGHSPNRYFDEIWYREAHADVRQGLIDGRWISGFEHYCAVGFATHDPHWLFDLRFYQSRYPALGQTVLRSMGYANAYEHFLQEGGAQGYSGHPFFDAGLCQDIAAACPEYFDPEIGLFGSWVALPAEVADSFRVSWYFDPVWYLQRYPAVGREIAQGRYASALHHYLTNQTPRLFDPQALFSEAFYTRFHSDVAPALELGGFRNAYDHFVRFGSQEGRAPFEGVDLFAHTRNEHVRIQVAGQFYHSPYAHLVAAHSGEESAAMLHAPAVSEVHTRRLFTQDAEALLPSVARHPLDFTVEGTPEVSVIMVVHDQIALTVQALASVRANYPGAIEVIIVDSGSHDETRHLPRLVRGAKILRYRYNIGYLDGCNAALRHVTAPVILYLNNDLRLYPAALQNALGRLHSDATIGAVGAKIIRTNMRLQEAGSIVWRDGATYGYLREDDPNIPQANFVRDVDYCSAAFLLVRTALIRRLGGYDVRYRPAYFEDADLCVRLIRAGGRIVYDPTVAIEHFEFGSSDLASSHALIQRNLRTFIKAQQEFLRHQQPAHIRNAIHGRERRGERKHILFIEDRLPLRRLGSGYVRSNDVVRVMAELGYHVTVFPMLPRHQSIFDLYSDFPDTVELMTDRDISGFAEFIQERAGYYDLVWVGRTHNMARLLPVLNELSRYLPQGGAVLDTEVVATPRTLVRDAVLGLSNEMADFDELLREELDCAHYCQQIVAVTRHDADLVRRAGYANVSVLGHEMRQRPTEGGFAERRDILFLGALHDDRSPNYDSLEWFVSEVLPCLLPLLPDDVRFTIAGFVHPSVDMTPLASHPRVDVLGAVDDLEDLFARHRVFVAPTRFAGGLPYKVQEAAAYGVPVVASALICQQVGWTDGIEILSGDIANPEAYAGQVARLYSDAALWGNVRQAALDAVARDCAPERFKAALKEILAACIA